jgi:hypothetical protein
MKLLTVQLPLFSCYLSRLRSKHSPQNPVLKHPQSKNLPYCARPSFTKSHQPQLDIVKICSYYADNKIELKVQLITENFNTLGQ